MDGWTIMTWDYNQESVYFCRWTECRHRCFESSVAILLPQLLYYSPSVEEWYHQMRSSLYLFSLLFSLTDTELPHITEITCTPITAKYFTKSLWPCAVISLTSFRFCWLSGSWHWTKITSPVLSCVSSLSTCRVTPVHSSQLFQLFCLNSPNFNLLVLSSKSPLFNSRHQGFIHAQM